MIKLLATDLMTALHDITWKLSAEPSCTQSLPDGSVVSRTESKWLIFGVFPVIIRLSLIIPAKTVSQLSEYGQRSNPSSTNKSLDKSGSLSAILYRILPE